MSRRGKIARLPREIREQLNFRLDNGEEAKQLVVWLNGLPDAQEVVAAQFGGRPISEQNVSEWKQGGYEDWLRHQEDCSYARRLSECASELAKEAAEITLEDRLAAPMALALARAIQEINERPNSAEKLEALVAVSQELAQLRRGTHEAERVRLERERWEANQAEEREKKRRNTEIEQQLKSEFPFLNSGNLLSQEVRDCLEANERLRRAHSGQSDKETGREAQQSIKPNQT